MVILYIKSFPISKFWQLYTILIFLGFDSLYCLHTRMFTTMFDGILSRDSLLSRQYLILSNSNYNKLIPFICCWDPISTFYHNIGLHYDLQNYIITRHRVTWLWFLKKYATKYCEYIR